jgi:Protein of unknown function (DUF4089)
MNDFDASAYAEAAARAIELELPEHCKRGVATNLERLAVMAEALLAFPLPPADSREPWS